MSIAAMTTSSDQEGLAKSSAVAWRYLFCSLMDFEFSGAVNNCTAPECSQPVSRAKDMTCDKLKGFATMNLPLISKIMSARLSVAEFEAIAGSFMDANYLWFMTPRMMPMHDVCYNTPVVGFLQLNEWVSHSMDGLQFKNDMPKDQITSHLDYQGSALTTGEIYYTGKLHHWSSVMSAIQVSQYMMVVATREFLFLNTAALKDLIPEMVDSDFGGLIYVNGYPGESQCARSDGTQGRYDDRDAIVAAGATRFFEVKFIDDIMGIAYMEEKEDAGNKAPNIAPGLDQHLKMDTAELIDRRQEQ